MNSYVFVAILFFKFNSMSMGTTKKNLKLLAWKSNIRPIALPCPNLCRWVSQWVTHLGIELLSQLKTVKGLVIHSVYTVQPENEEYIILWLFGHIFFSLSFFKPRNMNIHAYLGPYHFIFWCFFSYVTVEGVKSRNPHGYSCFLTGKT